MYQSELTITSDWDLTDANSKSIDNGHGEKWAQDQLNLATISCCQLSRVFIRESELTILATTSNSMGEGKFKCQ